MSKQTWPDCLAFIPHAIEPHWDNVWAPCLAGFPVNIVYAASIEGGRLAQATYVFDPGTLVDGSALQADAIPPGGGQQFLGSGCAPSRWRN